MDKGTYQIPRSLPVLAVVILAAMFYYAAFIEIPTPEDTVAEFYEAFFIQDFDLAAQNISVFWAAQLLPDYADHKPAQLLAERPALEKEAAKFFARVEEQNPTPPDVSIAINPAYSRTGEYSALVVYELSQGSDAVSMEIAILIKENDRFYIMNVIPLREENLKDVQEFDMGDLDADFQEILKL